MACLMALHSKQLLANIISTQSRATLQSIPITLQHCIPNIAFNLLIIRLTSEGKLNF